MLMINKKECHVPTMYTLSKKKKKFKHKDNQQQLTTTPELILICQFLATKPHILRGEGPPRTHWSVPICVDAYHYTSNFI